MSFGRHLAWIPDEIQLVSRNFFEALFIANISWKFHAGITNWNILALYDTFRLHYREGTQFWRDVFWAWNGILVKKTSFWYREGVNSRVVDRWQRKPFCQVMIMLDGSLADDWFIEAVLYNCRHTVIGMGRIPVARPISHQAKEWKERVNQKILWKQKVKEMKDYCKDM